MAARSQTRVAERAGHRACPLLPLNLPKMDNFIALHARLTAGIKAGVLTPSNARKQMTIAARKAGVQLPRNLLTFAHDDWREEVADIRREIAAKR